MAHQHAAINQVPVKQNRIQTGHRIWVGLTIAATIFVAPCFPSVSIILGVLVISACGFAISQFFHTVKGISSSTVDPKAQPTESIARRFLRLFQHCSNLLLKVTEPSIAVSGIRVSMYAGLGIILLTIGMTCSIWRTQRAFLVAEQHRIQAEQQKAIDQANTTVAALVNEAVNALEARDFQKADARLEAARKVSDATDFSQIGAMNVRVANAKVAALHVEATGSLRAGDILGGKRKLKAALAVPYATSITESQALDSLIARSTEPTQVRNALIDLSDEEFQKFAERRDVPPQWLTGYEVLNQQLSDIVKAEYDRVINERESRRLARIEAERKVKEKAEAAVAVAALQAEAKRLQDKLTAAAAARKAEIEKDERRRESEEAARKAEEESDVNGLVLLRKTVEGKVNEFGGEITGEVVNRRGKKLRYVQITFNLYDESGAQVGTALANVNGLEPGGRWRFKATSFGTDFEKFKFSELSGF